MSLITLGTVMKCETKEVNGVTVFYLSGDIIFNHIKVIRQQIGACLKTGSVDKVVFNLHNVGRIDSSGIGFLFTVFKQIQSDGGKFAVSNANEKVNSLLRSVGLGDLFTIHRSEEEALKSF